MAKSTKTYEGLLDAGRRLLPEAGLKGLTTGALTRELGVSQPAFYAHFKSMDAFIGVLVERVGAQFVTFMVGAQEHLREVGAADRAHVERHFVAIFEHMDSERAFVELFLVSRTHADVLGEELRSIEARMVDGITWHLQHNLEGWGVSPVEHASSCHQLAWVIYESLLTTYALVLRGQLPGAHVAARVMTASVMSASLAIFEDVPGVRSQLPLDWTHDDPTPETQGEGS